MTTDQFVTFQNIVWIVFSLSVAAGFTYRYLTAHRSDSGNRLMLGVILVALASACHRGYWALWRLERHWFGADSPQALWFVDNADYVGICIAVIAVGYSFHLYTVFRKWWGRLWVAVPFGMVALSYLAAITLAG